MSADTYRVQTRWYTAAGGTLRAEAGREEDDLREDTWRVATFEIKPPGMPWISRELENCETNSRGSPVDSQRWTDSIDKGVFGNEQFVSPWYVWKKAKEDVDKLRVLAAVDGSGKWTLALLPKADLRSLEKKRKEEANALRKQEKAQHELLKSKRAQEAKAQMASLVTACQSPKTLAVAQQPPARASMSRGSSVMSGNVRGRSSSLAKMSRRTRLPAGDRRSSIEKVKGEIAVSKRSSVSSSISSIIE